MRITRLPLHAVRHVERQPGPLALHDARHELLEPVDQVLVPLEGYHLVAARLERIGQAADRLEADNLPVRHPEQVDDVSPVPVVDDCDAHGV